MEASKGEPGFFAERQLRKLRKEYEQLYDTNMVEGNRSFWSHLLDGELEDDPECEDNTKPSILYFMSKFGQRNISEAISFLILISKEDDEDKLRIAHFFYHLGRNHERSIFK